VRALRQDALVFVEVGGACVLRDVDERFGDHEVGGELDRLRQAFAGRRLELDRERGAAGHRLECGVEPAVGEQRGVDATRQLAQLAKCGLELAARRLEEPASAAGILLHPALRHAQAESQRDEPLLCPVVEVALEAAPLRQAGFDHARTRCPQLLHLRPQLRVDALVLQARAAAAPTPRTSSGSSSE
jgi:hypothetical protein